MDESPIQISFSFIQYECWFNLKWSFSYPFEVDTLLGISSRSSKEIELVPSSIKMLICGPHKRMLVLVIWLLQQGKVREGCRYLPIALYAKLAWFFIRSLHSIGNLFSREEKNFAGYSWCPWSKWKTDQYWKWSWCCWSSTEWIWKGPSITIGTETWKGKTWDLFSCPECQIFIYNNFIALINIY